MRSALPGLLQLQCALCGSDVFEVHYSRVEAEQGAFYAFVCDKCAALHRLSSLISSAIIEKSTAGRQDKFRGIE